MIYYGASNFWSIIFQRRGSFVNPWISLRASLAAISAVVAVIAANHGVNLMDGFVKVVTESGILVTLLLAFRLTSAFTLWDSGVRSAGGCADAARCVMSDLLAYSTTDKDMLAVKLRKVQRYFVLFMMLMCNHVRGNESMFELVDYELLTEEEHVKLAECTQILTHKEECGHFYRSYQDVANIVPPELKSTERSNNKTIVTPTKARPTIVMTWIRMEVAKMMHAEELDARVVQNIDSQLRRMSEDYQSILKAAFTPIPFSYAQLLKCMILLYTIIAPWSYAPDLGMMSPIVGFIVAMIFFGAEDIAVEVEGPFGLDENDIDLVNRAKLVDVELGVMIDTILHHNVQRPPSTVYWQTHGRVDTLPCESDHLLAVA
eukprot:CFRG3478T1